MTEQAGSRRVIPKLAVKGTDQRTSPLKLLSPAIAALAIVPKAHATTNEEFWPLLPTTSPPRFDCLQPPLWLD